jgi:hypothetical protein
MDASHSQAVQSLLKVFIIEVVHLDMDITPEKLNQLLQSVRKEIKGILEG